MTASRSFQPTGRRRRTLVFALLTVAIGVMTLSATISAQSRDSQKSVSERVARIISRMERRDVDSIWNDVRSLEALGDSAVPVIREAIADANPLGRLGCAGALLRLGQAKQAVDELLSLVWNAPDRAIRIQSIRILASVEDSELRKKIATQFSERLEDAYAPAEKISLAKALWDISADDRPRAKDMLREVMKSDDPGTRLDAALALADLGEPYAARSVLREFKDDPTMRGELARSYYNLIERDTQISNLSRRLLEMQSGDRKIRSLPRNGIESRSEDLARDVTGSLEEHVKNAGRDTLALAKRAIDNIEDHEFLEEILAKVFRYYTKADEIDRETLIDGAARGILKVLDPHSVYFTGEELERWSFDLDPSYAGIGAYVNDIDGRFIIVRPIYSGPAYKAGLRIGDWIQEVDGWSTLDESVDEVTRRLKGLPGTPVKMRIARETWKESRIISVVRDNIDIPTAQGRMLPGQIGYVRLTSFGLETADEVESALRDLESAGMRGLVLDLRDNSGGYLTTARQVVDKFLPRGLLIVECKSVDGTPVPDANGEYQYFTTDNLHHDEVPMVVLINRNSASASEIVAGALKEHDRATLIGTRSYGKGSVQNMFPLRTRASEPHVDVARENGIWEEGEEYTDRNGNGQFDYGEKFVDVPRRNRRWDPGERFEDANGNSKWDAGESYTDSNRNGKYDAPEVFTDTDQDGSWDRGAHIKVTIARYYLPNGVSIHKERDAEGRVISEGGVEPDIVQKQRDTDLWILEEVDRLIEDKNIVEYIENLACDDPDLSRKLADFDEFKTTHYPGFNDLRDALETRIPDDDIRRVVRGLLRRQVQDIIGREFIQDIQEDTQLQRAVHFLADTLGIDLTELPSLAHIAGRFEQAASMAEDALIKATDEPNVKPK